MAGWALRAVEDSVTGAGCWNDAAWCHCWWYLYLLSSPNDGFLRERDTDTPPQACYTCRSCGDGHDDLEHQYEALAY